MSISTFRQPSELAPRQLTGQTPSDGRFAAAGSTGQLTTSVPKEFVHRAAIAEVLLTGWTRHDGRHFGVTAQWPRGHSFFVPIKERYHDPLMAAETVRQVGSLLAHAELGVPLGHHFLMSQLTVEVRPRHLRIGPAPADLEVEVTYTELEHNRGSHSGAHYATRIWRDGQIVATGDAAYICVTPRIYERLRGSKDRQQRALTAPVSPQSVGRLSPTDVVLSPAAGDNRWLLRVDTRHPVLFDHPVDHAPGMVLIEAARQAAASTLRPSCPLPIRVESAFSRYVELDAPCYVEARRLPRAARGDAVRVTGEQGGERTFCVTVTAVP